MKILILSNFGMGIYKFRKEIIEELIDNGYKVFVAFPKDEYVSKIEKLGCNYVEVKMDRRGVNIFNETSLLFKYFKIISSIKPDLVLTYTIKPNIYGAFVCRFRKIPVIANITGLGSAMHGNKYIKNLIINLYKISFKNINTVFFQNKNNKEIFIKEKIVREECCRLIPGSGVNIKEFKFQKYIDNSHVNFLYIGRIMKEKGIEELLEVAKKIKTMYKNKVSFTIVGFAEEDYLDYLNLLEEDGIIEYYGKQDNIEDFIKNSSAVVLPSYHEGMSNVLLEASAMGRPIIASNIPGCVEILDNNVTGILFEPKNIDSLENALLKFIKLPHCKKKKMGKKGRKKIVDEFSRDMIVSEYLVEIEKILRRN